MPKQNHKKLHVVMWRYNNESQITFHSQGYDTREIAMDKKRQLLHDSKHIQKDDILYRCIVFKFDFILPKKLSKESKCQ